MTTNPGRLSATIHPFPAGGRNASVATPASAKPVAMRGAPIGGGASYHEAAIQEAQRAGKR